MENLLAALLICSPLFIAAFVLVRSMKRESDGYSRMARTMREIRDWEREAGVSPEQSAIRPFKDSFK